MLAAASHIETLLIGGSYSPNIVSQGNCRAKFLSIFKRALRKIMTFENL